MDPYTIANLALLGIKAGLNIINHLKSSGALTPEQIAALADKQDDENAAQLKQLLSQ